MIDEQNAPKTERDLLQEARIAILNLEKEHERLGRALAFATGFVEGFFEKAKQSQGET